MKKLITIILSCFLLSSCEAQDDFSIINFGRTFIPKYVGFDELGMPVFIKSSGDVQAGSIGNGVKYPRKCFKYNPYTKLGYAAGSDGRLRIYDFKQYNIPEVKTVNINVGVALSFVALDMEEYWSYDVHNQIFVGDENGNVYASPLQSVESISFHQVTVYAMNGEATDLIFDGSRRFMVSNAANAQIMRYIPDDENTSGWQDNFVVSVDDGDTYSGITQNSSYYYALTTDDNDRKASKANEPTWNAYDEISSNNDGWLHAVSTGDVAYFLRSAPNKYLYKRDSSVNPITQIFSWGYTFNICSGPGYVIAIESPSDSDSDTIWYSEDGSSWTGLNYTYNVTNNQLWAVWKY